jgi:hypothetical protein
VILPPKTIAGVTQPSTLAAGMHITCAITGSHGVRCWGNQDLTVVREDGAGPHRRVHAGGGPGLRLRGQRRGVYCWGKNALGQLARPLDVTGERGGAAGRPRPRALPGRRRGGAGPRRRRPALRLGAATRPRWSRARTTSSPTPRSSAAP